ncbi:MAG: NBR1-Ig-like domain-containing protein [Bacteroidota bacterium]
MTPSITPTPSATPTATIDPACNRAQFLGDVTIPDMTTVSASTPFTKTWRIQNDGQCAWTTAYRLVLVKGSPLGAAESLALPAPVPPGQAIDLSIHLVAPAKAGRYQGFWALQAPNGQRFGVGASADEPIWVQILVEPAVSPSVTPTPSAAPTASATLTAVPSLAPGGSTAPEFAAAACSAQWVSNAGVVPCPGPEDHQAGSVQVLEQATLEDGTTTAGPALLVLPPNTLDGNIWGIYPAYMVQTGDHLQATVGCENGSAACSVLFTVAYQDESTEIHQVWSIGEFYDGRTFKLDLDLKQLAGKKVSFILGVSSLGSPTDDRALWVAPRITHSEVAVETPTAAPTRTPSATLTETAPAASATPRPIEPTLTAAPQAPGDNQAAPSFVRRLLEALLGFLQRIFGG